jgi:hypothetical protein
MKHHSMNKQTAVISSEVEESRRRHLSDPIEDWLETNQAISDVVTFVRFIAEGSILDGERMRFSEIQRQAKLLIAEVDKSLRK